MNLGDFTLVTLHTRFGDGDLFELPVERLRFVNTVAGRARHVSRVVFTAGPVVVLAARMARRAGFPHLSRRHLLEVLDVTVAICIDVLFARTVATFAGVFGGRRARVLRAPMRRLVIPLLILVTLEALLFAYVRAG